MHTWYSIRNKTRKSKLIFDIKCNSEFQKWGDATWLHVNWLSWLQLFGQSFSSSPLLQSLTPLQRLTFGIHSNGKIVLFSWIHWNSAISLQVIWQFFSSDPSLQFLVPSHFLAKSMHSKGKILPFSLKVA